MIPYAGLTSHVIGIYKRDEASCFRCGNMRMPTMTITVNKPSEKVNVCEDGKTELKSSIFFLPAGNMPDVKQMREIAASVAAFMNAEGGVLYIGVADDGTLRGIEVSGKAYFCDKDKIVHRLLAHFGIDASRVAVRPK